MGPASINLNSAPNFDNLQGALNGYQHAPQYPNPEQPLIVAPTPSAASRWANIPAELQALRRWAVAGACFDPDEPKAPHIVLGDKAYRVSVNRPEKLMAYDEAVRFACRFKDASIGFVLCQGDGFTCIDMDVKDSNNEPNPAKWTTQEQLDGFQKAIESFDSYTERSRSGKGYHTWVRAEVGKGGKGGVEIYSQERFIICTGDVFRDRPIEPRQELAEILRSELKSSQSHAEPLPSRPQTHSDEEVLGKARAARNGDKFSTLYDTPVQETGESEGDQALMNLLAFNSPNDEQVERLFMASARAKRTKVQDDRRYVLLTIETARKFQAADWGDGDLEHGKEIGERLLAAYDAKQQRAREARKSRFRIHTVDEIVSRPPMQWWVKGVIPRQGIGSIYGQPGSGKSFLAIDLLAAIQKGEWWFGYRTKHCPVVYLAMEGQGGLGTRLKAYSQQKGHNGIRVMEMPFDIRDAEQRADLIEAIHSAGLANGIVCLDTLAASAAGMEENSSADMGEVIEGMKEIQRELNACVLFVHHAGKNGDKGMRGHSSLLGAVDFAIEVTREEKGDKCTWRVAKSKDGEGNIQRDFKLLQTTVGYDEDGEPITSCYIDLASARNESEERKPNAAEQDRIDDQTVWDYIYSECEAGNFPSRNSCKHKGNDIRELQPGITNTRIASAIGRLLHDKRVVEEKPNGNPNLRAVQFVPR